MQNSEQKTLYTEFFSNSKIFWQLEKRLKMLHFFVQTTGIFNRAHSNVSMMLYSPEYRAENGTICFFPFCFTESRKDKVGLDILYLLPMFSHSLYFWGIWSCSIALDTPLLQSHFSVLPWVKQFHHPEAKDDLQFCEELHNLPYKAAYELSNCPQAFTSFTAMKYYHKSSFNLLPDLEYLKRCFA